MNIDLDTMKELCEAQQEVFNRFLNTVASKQNLEFMNAELNNRVQQILITHGHQPNILKVTTGNILNNGLINFIMEGLDTKPVILTNEAWDYANQWKLILPKLPEKERGEEPKTRLELIEHD